MPQSLAHIALVARDYDEAMIGGAVLALLPGSGEAAGIEPGQQPHQQPVARQPLPGDQNALLPDLLGAAVDRAIESQSGEAGDGELVGRVPGRGEGRRARATGDWTKRDRDPDSETAGKFMDVKSDGTPFKGVAKEPDGRCAR